MRGIKAYQRHGGIMMSKQLNLQDTFLNQVRKENIAVTMFLVNGFQLKGYVKGFDNFIVLMEVEGRQQMIYKHAISTMVPAKNIPFGSNTEENL